jgi:hypothetical protein
MPVHDVDVQHFNAGSLNLAHIFAQAHKIGG